MWKTFLGCLPWRWRQPLGNLAWGAGVTSCTSHCLSSEATVSLLKLFPSQHKALYFWISALLQRSRHCCSTCNFTLWNKWGLWRRVLPNVNKHPGLYLPKPSLPSETPKRQLQDSKFYRWSCGQCLLGFYLHGLSESSSSRFHMRLLFCSKTWHKRAFSLTSFHKPHYAKVMLLQR